MATIRLITAERDGYNSGNSPVIYILLFLLGVLVATQLNRGIYRLAWFARPIGPWSAPHQDAPGRRWADRIPVIGWLALSREASLHGRGFWIRPMLIELATGICFAGLYWHEVGRFVDAQQLPSFATLGILQAQYFSHIILFSLMLVATFIDFDEQTIPDAITVPGAIIGLILAAALPMCREIVWVGRPPQPEFLSVVSGVMRERNWLALLASERSLLIGLACFLGWCVAVVPWLWTTRRGLGKAFQYFAASFRRRLSLGMVLVAVVGTATIALVWVLGNAGPIGPQHRWDSLFSALVGMAAGGGLIWAVRIVGSHALGQEAMGFGDVTLMAMIGAFLGWQSTLIIFFLAPFAALFISVSQWLLTRRRDIAFGPYLCAGACYLVVDWDNLWNRARPIFELGLFVPGVLAVGLALMGIMLIGLRWLRETFLGVDEEIDDSNAPLPAAPSSEPAAPEDSN
ncbi:MAG: prepilin peptidase [Planctomycetota bacterium]|nr:prepilin peptidase [Planctomycetota bacterium]